MKSILIILWPSYSETTPSLVGNIAAVACYIATQNTLYTIWQYKESTSNSLFETPFVHAIWSYFFNRRLLINIQRLTVHFISTIPNVIHVFGHVFFCKACHICLHCKWTVKHAHILFCHIRVRSITFGFTFAKSVVCQSDTKDLYIYWTTLTGTESTTCQQHVIEDYECGRIMGYWWRYFFF